MLKKLLLLLLTCFSSLLFTQTSMEEELKIIETPEQIESFLETKNPKNNKLVTFNEEKHKTILAKELFELSVGGTKITENEFEKTYYKIVEKTKNTYYRLAYIYLDGTKYDVSTIFTLRNKIIAKYKSGAPFDFLAKRYSMDQGSKKGGDLGWFTKGTMHPDFEHQTIDGNHYLNDIFTVDIPSSNWYYVVLKTHEPKEISEINVLKIVETKL